MAQMMELYLTAMLRGLRHHLKPVMNSSRFPGVRITTLPASQYIVILWIPCWTISRSQRDQGLKCLEAFVRDKIVVVRNSDFNRVNIQVMKFFFAKSKCPVAMWCYYFK